MPVHFAAARCTARSHVARALNWKTPSRPANDNGEPVGGAFVFDPIMRDALIHFAEFGLSAASQARRNAEAANTRGDVPGGAHWKKICMALDRKQASEFERALIRENEPLIG